VDEYKILDKIDSPEDLKSLEPEEIELLNEEIRDFLIDNVSRNGGHLASNLGVVELSVAIHRVFDSPKDHIIWDVGHQSYVHKLLTGRRAEFDTLRTPGGISGFVKRAESEHDCFGAGHSSTSISAALGFAEADHLNGSDAYTVAVVGDGAFTGGMIHEGLNNCRKDLKLIIILNENEMSISKNIGQFAKNLSKLRMRPGYFKAKRFTGNVLKHVPFVGKHLFRFALRVKKAFKNMMYGSNYFEDMGLYYLGPIDGNDYESMEKILTEAKKLKESAVIHIKTVKGKGYDPAEESPDKYHGVAPNNTKKKRKTLTDVFGECVCELAEGDERICAITAAMCDGTGLNSFKEKYPDRFFDVGIAEEHAVTFGAGLAASGMKPLVAIYSTFLQRSYDNVIHDVALQNLPVTLCIDRAGLNSRDGATHHGIFDVAFLSHIPNMTIYTPTTEESLSRLLREAIYSGTPSAIRYSNFEENERVVNELYSDKARKCGYAVCNYNPNEKLDGVIVTYGKIVGEALKAIDLLKVSGKNIGIVLLEKLKPYGEIYASICKLLPENVKMIALLEEGIEVGGAGMILNDKFAQDSRFDGAKRCVIAIDDDFVIPKVNETMYDAAGISCDHIVKKIEMTIK